MRKQIGEDPNMKGQQRDPDTELVKLTTFRDRQRATKNKKSSIK
jgi:hypothetical protein